MNMSRLEESGDRESNTCRGSDVGSESALSVDSVVVVSW